MLYIVITSPTFFNGEAAFLNRLAATGVDFIHLRKPNSDIAECSKLLEDLAIETRRHIIIHDYFELAEPYGLHGIHLNARRNEPPCGYTGHISHSCHSLEEVCLHKGKCDYVFLSPIFDSVSKQGYASAFTDATLRQAAADGIIDRKVVALGGVMPDKISYLRSLGFGGAAMLGCVNSLASLPYDEQTDALNKIKNCFI